MPRASCRVSILTCAYNHVAYIDACAKSIIAQHFTDWEWLVRDNGSSDGTYDRLVSFSDERIHLSRGPARSYRAVVDIYNELLAEARGEWIAFLDSDDIWLPERLSIEIQAVKNTDAIVCHAPIWLMNAKGEFKRILKASEDPRVLTNKPLGTAVASALGSLNFPCYATTLLIKTETLKRAGGFVPGPALYDFSTLLEVGLYGPFAYVDRPLAGWRCHESQVSMSTQTMIETAQTHYERSMDFLNQKGSQLEKAGFSVQDIQKTARQTLEKLRRSAPLLQAHKHLDIEAWENARGRYIDFLRQRGLRLLTEPKECVMALVGLFSTVIHYNLLAVIAQMKSKLRTRAGP